MPNNLVNKTIQTIIRVIAALALTLVLLSVYLNSKWGQARLSKILFTNVSKQLGVPVSGELSFSIPDWVIIDRLLILDQKADTLLYSGHAKLDVALFKLLKNQLVIEQVKLEDVLANIDKNDDEFNFNFLLDAFSSDEESAKTDNEPLKITLDKISLERLKAEYREDKIGRRIVISLGALDTGFKNLELDEGIYDLKDINLSNLNITGAIGQAEADSSEPLVLPDIRLRNLIADNINWDLNLGENTTAGTKANLKIKFSELNLPENQISINAVQSSINELSFKNIKSKPVADGQINFDDIELDNIRLLAENIQINDSIQSVVFKDLGFSDQSGFVLKNLSVAVKLKGGILTGDKIEINASESYLKSDFVAYLDDKDYLNSQFNVDITDIKLSFSDALYFDQNLKKDDNFRLFRNDFIKGNGKLKGTFNNISIEKLNVFNTSNTRLSLNGKIANKNPIGFDLVINNFSPAQKDINKFISENNLSIEIPKNISLNGKLKGDLENIGALINISTNQGKGQVNLNLKNLSKIPSYHGEIILNEYNLGQLLKNEELGKMVAKVNFVGTGFDKPDVKFDGFVSELAYQNETFKDFNFQGGYKDDIVNIQGGIDDLSAGVSFDLLADLSGDEPKISGKTNLGKIDLKALGLMDEQVIISGDLEIKQLTIDPKKPYIDISGKNITIFKDSLTYDVGSLSLFTSYGEEHKSLYFFTDFADISLSGNFEYDQLRDILIGEVDKYFEIPDFVPVNDSLNYYFDLNGVVNYHPVMTAFVPALLDFETITLESNLNSDQAVSFSGNIEIPYLLYDSVRVNEARFNFSGDGEKLDYNLLSRQLSSGNFRLRKASLTGGLSDNKADFNLSVKDSLEHEIHSLAGFLQSDGKSVKVSFDETGTMIFYQNWGGNPYGYIEYSEEGLHFNNIVFSTQNQLLRIHNINDQVNGPLMVYARNIDLNFFSKAILQDSTLLSGSLKLDLILENYMGDEPIGFDGLAVINDLEYDQMALGQATVEVENAGKDQIKLIAALAGDNADLQIAGAYFTQQDEPLDLTVNLNSFNPKLIDSYLEDVLYDLNAKITGVATVKGSLEKPDINGEIILKNGEFRIKETAALLRLDNQKINIDESILKFNNFIIKDINDQDLNLTGQVTLSNFPDINYDLNIGTDNFMISNSEMGQSELFFGKAFLKSKLNLKGVNSKFRLTGDINVLEPSNLTLLLPEDDFGEDLSNVVTFVEFNNPEKNIVKKGESGISFANALNLNVFADEKSVINILMDPISGDKLSGQGDINLNVGFDNAGDLFMVGNLAIKKGSYDLTFQTINKHFEINEQSQSTVTFTGDPLKGKLNVTAEYKVPGKKDIAQYPELKSKDVKAQKNIADLRVDLILTGEIMSPDIEFQIVTKKDDINNADLQSALPEVGITLLDDKGQKIEESGSAVTTAFKESLRQNAIMLLLANNFTASQIFESFTSATGAGYEDLARRNASQLISAQLEKYASELIKGVDVNLGLQSSGGYSETGSDRSTNINLGVSKGLANNRLVVSVGKNFELENKEKMSDEVFDNVEANWLITPEGRYRLKIFRKTQNQTALEGSVIETGLGFIIAIDYESWLDLVRKKK